MSKAQATPPPLAPLPPPRAHRLFAAVLLLALCAGLLCGLEGLRRAVPVVAALPPSAWRNGDVNRALEKQQTLPAADTLHALNEGLQYRLFGDLGTQVSEGCPGWLFYRDGLRPQAGVDPAAIFDQHLRLMRYYVAQLRQSGVQVLVVTVPDKSRIETAALCGLHATPAMAAGLARWQAVLQREGVPYVDLRATLDQARPAFFRTDVHWNGRGAQAAAQAVAQAALPLLGGMGSQGFTTETGAAPVPRMGDLIVLAGLEYAPAFLRPPLDDERPVTIRPQHSGGLLDTPEPPQVLVAGSSNSRRSNFAERLGQDLGREVWNRSLDGGNFAGALQPVLAERATWPHGLKLVIWEMSEMSLWLPLSAPDQALLASGAAP